MFESQRSVAVKGTDLVVWFRHQPPRDKHDLSHHKIAVCLTAPLYKTRVLPLTPRRTAVRVGKVGGCEGPGMGHVMGSCR